MASLNLCKDHRQEWKGSEYDPHNCDHCKALKSVPVWSKDLDDIPEEIPVFAWTAFDPDAKRKNWIPAVLIKKKNKGGELCYYLEDNFSPAYVFAWTVATVPEGR